nr:hypothetical protein [Tanacetum cinerariifolium]
MDIDYAGSHFVYPAIVRTEDHIVIMLSEPEDLVIEGSKSWEAKYRKLFTMSYPYVFLNVPPPPPESALDIAGGNDIDNAIQVSPPATQQTVIDIPFGTTT